MRNHPQTDSRLFLSYFFCRITIQGIQTRFTSPARDCASAGKGSSIMRQTQYAILIAQGLSYAMIITFIFADARYNLSGILRGEDFAISFKSAHVAASLIGIVGAISIWLTWQYMTKSSAMRDMVVICAWTHSVKTKDGWVPLEKFFTDQLGYAISHGMSEAKFQELRGEVDQKWKETKAASLPSQSEKNEGNIAAPNANAPS